MAEEKKEKKGLNKNLLKHIVIQGMGAVFVIALLLGYFTGVGKTKGLGSILVSLEETSLNWRFSAKAFTSGARIAQAGVTQTQERDGWYKKIYIAGIDEDAIAEWGLPPFERTVYADIIDGLSEVDEASRPAAVLFDVVFDTYGIPENDEALWTAIRNYPDSVGIDHILEASKNVVYDKSDSDTSELWSEQLDKIYLNDSTAYESVRAQSFTRFEIHSDQFELSKKEMAEIPNYNISTLLIPEVVEGLTFTGPANMAENTVTMRKKPLLLSILYSFTNEEGVVDITNIYYPDILLSAALELYDADVSDLLIRKGEIVIQNAMITEFDMYGRAVPQEEREDVVIPVDERFRLAINYKAPEAIGYVNFISLADVATSVANPARYGLTPDMVMMIGVYSKGLTGTETSTDVWRSPLGNMYGISHLAYGLGTIMNQDFIHEAPDWLNIIYPFLLVMVIGFMIARGIKWTMGAGLIAIFVPLITGFLLFQFNVDIVMMVPLLGGILTLIAGEIYLLTTEEKEKKFIKSTFSSYVNPDLVDILIQNPEMMGLGGVSKDLTILFSDIRSFTTLSEGMTPEYLINFLNVYLTKMTDIVMDTKGTLDKYIGDAVMAFWGAPIELENHALISCRAALLMMDALDEFNEERAKVGDKPIDIGIGLNSAVVSVGNVGSEVRKNYTVIGDGVNLASRLEGANKAYKTHIIISEFTYEKVKDDVIVRELDLLTVKGKKLPVKIYELWGMKEDVPASASH